MKKHNHDWIWFVIIILFMLVIVIIWIGANNEKRIDKLENKFPKVWGCETKDKRYATVICDKQEIWDNRGKIDSFKCKCKSNDCRTFPVQRFCTAITYDNIRTDIRCSQIQEQEEVCGWK